MYKRQENTLQSAEESAVTKLLVVVFNDPDGENNNKVIYDREENTSDTFLKVEEIQLADQPLTNQEYICLLYTSLERLDVRNEY